MKRKEPCRDPCVRVFLSVCAPRSNTGRRNAVWVDTCCGAALREERDNRALTTSEKTGGLQPTATPTAATTTRTEEKTQQAGLPLSSALPPARREPVARKVRRTLWPQEGANNRLTDLQQPQRRLLQPVRNLSDSTRRLHHHHHQPLLLLVSLPLLLHPPKEPGILQ